MGQAPCRRGFLSTALDWRTHHPLTYQPTGSGGEQKCFRTADSGDFDASRRLEMQRRVLARRRCNHYVRTCLHHLPIPGIVESKMKTYAPVFREYMAQGAN